MANRYAVIDGNWSSTSTWDGGTLPGVGDDVWCNGNEVIIDQDITVASLRNDNTNGMVSSASKNFVLAGITTRVINADIQGDTTGAVAYYILRFTFVNNGLNLTINGNILGHGVGNGYRVMYGTGFSDLTLTINGDIYESGHATPTIEFTTVAGTGRSKLTVNGNITNYDLTASNSGNLGGGIKLNGISFDFDFTGVIHNLHDSANIGTAYNAAIEVNTDSVINIDLGSSILKATNKAGGKGRIQCISSQQTVNITAGEIQGSVWGRALILGGSNTSQCTYIVNADIKSGGYGSSAVYGGNLNTDTTSLLTINGDIYRCSTVSTSDTLYTLDTSLPTIINGDIKAGGYSTAILADDDKLFVVNGTVYGEGGNTSVRAVAFSAAKTLTPYFQNIVCGSLANTKPIIDQLSTATGGIEVANFTQRFPAIQITDGHLHYTLDGSYTFYTKTGVGVALTTAAGGVQPIEADVRSGVDYGNNKTGTLVVPNPQYVSPGVLTDNTVGTMTGGAGGSVSL